MEWSYPRVREARPWALFCNLFEVKTAKMIVFTVELRAICS